MAPLAEHLVGYLSMFLQLGVLALLAVLAVLVRISLGRRPFDAWTLGLAANALALLVLAVAALGADAGLLPRLPAATILYALLEDLSAVAFIAGARLLRGARPVPGWLVGALAVAMVVTTLGSMKTVEFLDVFRLHSTFFALLLAAAVVELVRARLSGLGSRLLAVALAALALDYAHVPLLTLAGVRFPDNYLGLESYVTMVLDIALGVALVVQATDAAHVELERRNAELAGAQRALHEAAFTDALCAIPNRAAFLERVADPPAAGVFAMIDLDGLKAINDRFGHAAGDKALATAARCLRERAGAGGTIYRIGGDEFAGIWDGAATGAVRALLAACERDLAGYAEDTVLPAQISWGVAAFDARAPLAEAMIAADAQLYDRRSVRRP
ncbi:MAG TPA: GGDEF domain-containing protein [Candidatus Elarobacter sp.]|jgi:diguanylate cyclase (GGDEF)-like protein|nr:GGDEF domain-containing protein [Candidatus Elarobacter sp.]